MLILALMQWGLVSAGQSMSRMVLRQRELRDLVCSEIIDSERAVTTDRHQALLPLLHHHV